MTKKLVLGLAMVVALAAGPATARGDSEKPGTPAAVANAVSGPIIRGSDAPRRVSVQEARSAAAMPGARVEVPKETTPAQSVGSDGAAATAAEYCWQHSPWMQWGTWPYQQRVTDHTYWCAVYGRYITYRTQYVRLGTTLCDHSGAYGFRISGGVNHSWVETQAGGHFSCPTTIPWFTIHTDRWFRVARNAWGNWAYTSNS